MATIVSVSITNTTPRVTQQGFGIPMILGYHTAFPELVRSYASLTAVASDFATTDPEYKKAAAMFAQNPSPEEVMIGRMTTGIPQWSVEMTPVELTEGYEYSVTIGTETATYTNGAAETVAGITAGLQASIAALTGAFTATDNTTNVGLAADVDGTYFDLFLPQDGALRLEDVSTRTAGDVNSDLAAIYAVDTSWYAFCMVPSSKADIASASTFADANKRFFAALSGDYEVTDAVSTTDAGYVAQAASRAWTKVNWSQNLPEHFDAAWLGRMLPENPGAATWEYKTLSGVTAPGLPALNFTQQGALDDKNVGYYQTFAGNNSTRNSKMADGEWMDIRRGIDWTEARIQENVVSQLFAVKKIPYTEFGVNLIKAQIDQVLRQGAARGLYVEDSITISFPAIGDISALDKSNRFLPDGMFSAQLQGAIHTTSITGEVFV